MSAALPIFYSSFDAAFFKLPPHAQSRIEAKVDAIGLRLKTFPHSRLKGHDRFRVRVGDYRNIYTLRGAERHSSACGWQPPGNLPGLLSG